MSIISEGIRSRVAADLLKNREEMIRVSNNIINDILVRRAKLTEIRAAMAENPDIFTAADMAAVDETEMLLFQKVQQVYDIFTANN